MKVQLPERALPLFEPARYKVLYGGRGSGKSWAVARALLLKAAQDPLRVLCARELQNSIDESVLNLLASQIDALGLTGAFDVRRTTIEGHNGSQFIFSGLRHNTHSLKSLEGIDVAWVEEAHVVSKSSWDILTPTIRKPGSEIWVTFNPDLDIDETYQRFVVNPPRDAIVIELHWRHNPWWNDVLEQERLDTLRRDPVGYQTIWEGKCRRSVEGAIYGDELDKARDEGRVCTVPYDPTQPVHTAWDLGVLDSTAIWFCQQTRGGEVRLIDYYEASGEGLPHYARVLQGKGYTFGRHIGPHDIMVRELGSGRSRFEVAADLGIRFEVAPRHELEDGVHAVRMLFPRFWFDKERTRAGVQALAHYRKAYNAALDEFKASPVHDWASHGADALRYLATTLQEPATRRTARSERMSDMGWMG